MLKQAEDRAGGAANVAANLSGLGLPTQIIGCIGDDESGHTLIKLMAKNGIDISHMVSSAFRPTVSKTRVMSGNQQIVRIDDESSASFNPQECNELMSKISLAINAKPAMVKIGRASCRERV